MTQKEKLKNIMVFNDLEKFLENLNKFCHDKFQTYDK